MTADPVRRSILSLGWVSFLTDVSSDMIYPLLPGFLTKTLGAGPAAVGLIEGVAESTASLTKIGSGVWSDRVRRRKPLVVLGYAVATIARPLVAFARAWTQVLAIRFVDRVGKGIRTSPRDALLADLVPPEKRGRAFGLQRAMDNAGAFVGPLLAALLLKLAIVDVRGVFLLAAIPGIAALIVLLVAVPDTPRRAESAVRDLIPEGGQIPQKGPLPRAFWQVVAIFAFFTLANSTDAFLLLRAQQAGLATWQLPIFWSFFQGVKAATGVPGGAVADRVGRVPAITLGWIVYAAAYAGFAFVARPLAVWGLVALYALFYGLTEGSERAFVADLVPERLRGRAYGIFHAAIGITAFPASVLFGLLWKRFSPRVAFLTGAAVALAAAAALWAATGAIRDARSRAEAAAP
ncbi:MAG TPA: MFS transporter [Thermoanaerobaculia bacterium]|jgi:MFS family permease|nr:MFS transporter [Thermoanaerobaculia bacterium]HEV8611577.1 MFS transporter [Thermoanaerobaculia bacterium]